VSVAVFGLNGRGMVHAENFSHLKNSSVAYLVDVDSTVLAKAAHQMKTGDRPPKAIGDFRRALEDPTVDAVSIATPDHWHTPMAILAMKAGKHVYVEKPCGHNPREGELIVAAQKASGKVVQMGTQQRSSARTIEALQRIKDGVIGRPYLARAWYANTRTGIGQGKPAPVPAHLDYALWQGPRPHAVSRQRDPLQLALVHGLGHRRDLQQRDTRDRHRAPLGVEHPTRVLATGGRRHYEATAVPDSQEATFGFAAAIRAFGRARAATGTIRSTARAAPRSTERAARSSSTATAT
jgi:hypothetical protein